MTVAEEIIKRGI